MAGLLFAVADSHAMAAGWLAGRNGLLCLVCGLAALHQHLSWRRTGSPRFLAYALLLFALGLGCGEAARGSSIYLDPGSEPRLFLQAVIERAPLLAAAQWVKAPAEGRLLVRGQRAIEPAAATPGAQS